MLTQFYGSLMKREYYVTIIANKMGFCHNEMKAINFEEKFWCLHSDIISFVHLRNKSM